MNEILRKDLIKTNNGEMIFQAPTDNNCAGWIQTVFSRLFSHFTTTVLSTNFFMVDLEDVDLPAPLGLCSGNPKKGCCGKISNLARLCIAYCMGSSKSLSIKATKHAVSDNAVYQAARIALPAKLFHIQAGDKQNLLYWKPTHPNGIYYERM